MYVCVCVASRLHRYSEDFEGCYRDLVLPLFNENALCYQGGIRESKWISIDWGTGDRAGRDSGSRLKGELTGIALGGVCMK